MRRLLGVLLLVTLVMGCGATSSSQVPDAGAKLPADVVGEAGVQPETTETRLVADSESDGADTFDLAPECVPVCAGLECGDDGCGGQCGQCPEAAPVCSEGKCTVECIPDCDGKECGPDGCQETCGECLENHVCLSDGTCLCQPQCGEDDCGDDGCGGQCGECLYPAAQCVDGKCICTPQCEGKQCGDDGCGGQCGECPVNHDCLSDGTCLCIPDCTATQCGGDGCGGSCGGCGCGEYCINGLCEFTACDGKECGADGCGGVCGGCAAGLACVQGLCPPEGQTCEDFNEIGWDGCTQGDLSEFLVNETVPGDQKAPVLAVLGDGRWVAAWQSDGQDGDSEGVYARLLDPVTGKDGLEFAVNSYTNGSQRRPAVAAVPGGFAVVWVSTGQDSFLDGVFGRVFDLSGNSISQELQVNLFTSMNQTDPCVVGLPDGFVVAWQSDSQDGSNTGVFAQRFTGLGEKAGPEFQVNAYTLSSQNMPSLAALEDGFAAVWSSFTQDGSDFGVISQQFKEDGTKQWDEFQVNTFSAGQQVWPDAAALGGQNYVVVWQSLAQDGDDYGIYGQRLGPPAGKKGAEFPVNTHTAQKQEYPTVGGNAAGRFAVAWQSCPFAGAPDPGQDSDGCGIYARRFKSNGSEEGGEIAANSFTGSDQSAPDLAMFPDGSFAIVWQSCPPAPVPASGQDSDGCGIYARRFAPDGALLYR